MFGNLLAGAVGSLPSVTVTLTNSATSSFDSTSPYENSKCGVIFNSDGTKDEWNDANLAQADSGTDWIIPNQGAPWATYVVKLDSFGPDSLAAGSSAVGSWIAISGAKWFMEETGAGSYSGSGTVRISDDGGSTTLDTMTLSCTIDNV
jgi:hypothetical protein